MNYRKAESLAVDPAKPFENDRFERKSFAENLTAMVGTLTQPMVLALDGRWGSGKTTFLAMWQPLLERDGHLCVTFNAWQNDFAADPLIAMIAAVQEQVAAKATGATAFWNKARDAGEKVTAALLPLLVRVGTGGMVGMDDLRPAMTQDVAEHVKATNIVAEFRHALAEFAAEAMQRTDGKTRSLIVLVDELDRCRPPFAVTVLERIKHLFNVPNVVFVLALDKAQLGHSVRTLYGSEIDAEKTTCAGSST